MEWQGTEGADFSSCHILFLFSLPASCQQDFKLVFVKLNVRVNGGLCYIECLSVCVHVLDCMCINVSVCSKLSFKCGNMLSLGIRGSRSENKTLLKYCNLRNSKTQLWHVTLQYYNTYNLNKTASMTLIHQAHNRSTILAVLEAQPLEPPLLSHVTVAGLLCLSRKPQMSRKPLDISANHSSLNKHFLNGLREKETRDRQTTEPNKAPRPLTNLNPN